VRYKSVLGLAIGERSLLAAEVVMGDRPVVRRVAELEYPPGVSPGEASQFGPALDSLRKKHGFSTRATVVGLPARWIVVKQKDVPSTDATTLSGILRTSAEGEFSSELKNMTFDYVESQPSAAGKTVLLVGTPKKYIDAIAAACDTAKLTPIAITSSALVLGAATGNSSKPAGLVLAIGATGAELTAQQNGAPSAVQHLRAPEPSAPFVSAIRRAVSTIPSPPGGREILLWDQTGLDAQALGQQLGMTVRSGELSSLGVEVAIPSLNGTAGRYAPAVALAMSMIGEARPGVDFLHSRLAPPRTHRLPRWAYLAIALGVVLIGLAVYSYVTLSAQQTALMNAQNKLKPMTDNVAKAKSFIAQVSYAQAWQAGDHRYLACLKGLTQALSDDEQTYAINVTLKEVPRAGTAAANLVDGEKTPPSGALSGTINSKATDPNGWSKLQSKLQKSQALGFTEVQLHNTTQADRSSEVSFSISFNYQQPVAAH
jgi:hypothetical protein